MKKRKSLVLVIIFSIIVSCENSPNPENQILTKETTINSIQELQAKATNNPRSLANRNQIDDQTFLGLNEKDVQIVLQPKLSVAAKTLLEFGWSEEELVEDFGSINSPEIFSMATAAITINEDFDLYDKNGEIVLIPKVTTGSDQSEEYDQLKKCFLDATGIGLAMGALGIGGGALLSKAAKKKAIKKAIRKAISRTLGWVGVAWAVYDFGYCMEWW